MLPESLISGASSPRGRVIFPRRNAAIGARSDTCPQARLPNRPPAVMTAVGPGASGFQDFRPKASDPKLRIQAWCVRVCVRTTLLAFGMTCDNAFSQRARQSRCEVSPARAAAVAARAAAFAGRGSGEIRTHRDRRRRRLPSPHVRERPRGRGGRAAGRGGLVDCRHHGADAQGPGLCAVRPTRLHTGRCPGPAAVTRINDDANQIVIASYVEAIPICDSSR